MEYRVISGDSHIDLSWLPTGLFVSNAPAGWREKVLKVVEREDGRFWEANGVSLGRVGGLGLGAVQVRRGEARHIDRMIDTGFFEDATRGVFRPTLPEMRLKDQDLDGVQAEVIYGITGVGLQLSDPELVMVIYQIYNDWVADFCKADYGRLGALACIPNHDPKSAAREMRCAASRGLVGADFSVATAGVPLYDREWDVLWGAAAECGMPISLHTLGWTFRQSEPADPQAYMQNIGAIRSSLIQLAGAEFLATIILSGACERHPGFKFVLGESGVSWIPYLLDRMDIKYHNRFSHPLSIKPSEVWRRQGYSTFQEEGVAGHLVPLVGEDNVIWGSDYPHPDGVWPDSLKAIEKSLPAVHPQGRRKVTCENAGRLYGFIRT